MKTTEAIQHEKPLLHMLGVESWLRAHGKFVRPELTKQQKQELNECFDLIDADGSGAIDADELLTAFNVLGLHVKRSEIEKMLAEVDADGSGEVEYPEFVQIMTSKLETQSQEVDSEEKSKKQPLPFQLLAQAYRRKKLIDAVMSGDKATQQRLRTKAEAAEAERQAVLAAMDAEKQNPALRFDKKNMKTLSGNKYQRMQPSQREFETDHVVEDLDDGIKKIVLECLEEETIQSSQSESKRVQNNDPMLKQRSSLIEGRNQTNRLQITKSSSLDKNSVQGTFKQELADLGRQRSRVLHKPVLEHQLRHLRAIKSIQDYVKLKDIQNIKYLK